MEELKKMIVREREREEAQLGKTNPTRPHAASVKQTRVDVYNE